MKLIAINPPSTITEPQIPDAIARDSEVAAAISTHVAAADPHPTYLTQTEGDGRYRQTATPLSDADIPAVIARDSEVTAAISAHVAAADPHPAYLTQTEGDGRYRQNATPLTDADIPAAIARDSEVTAAIATHVAAADPHPTYLTQAEGDGRYRSLTSTQEVFFAGRLPLASVAGNSIALGWNSVQAGQGIGELCNYAGLGGGDAFNFFRQAGSSASRPTLTQRVSRIDINGNYVATSDRRIKSDLTAISGLDAILRLEPYKYRHHSNNVFTDGKIKKGEIFSLKIGFIAQDVAEVIPEAVVIPKSDEELWGVDCNCILACAVQAIKELHAIVKESQST